jgi:UDP-N-acetylmuramate--alanine ligase
MKNIWFVGIGGIGMSALASYYLSKGNKVWGYDRNKSQITEGLEVKGAQITYVESTDILNDVDICIDNTLVIYTPALSQDSFYLKYFKENNFSLYKRSEILGKISAETYCIAVAGTHGKTTTSSILAHIFTVANTGSYGFLGGLSTNYNSNYIEGDKELSIVEADEFDRSFLRLSPNMACITTMDPDHLDIYKTNEAFEESFFEFASLVEDVLLVRKGVPISGITYGLEGEGADYEVRNAKIIDGSYFFDVSGGVVDYKDLKFSLPGEHNLLNALAAIGLAERYGVSEQNISKALESYKGVERRFSTRIHNEELILVDDYAHHPTEIEALLEALRSFYPKEKITGIFQPHLFSRTKDFAKEFATVLSGFDELYLMEIYPAREIPIPGVNSKWLMEMMECDNVQLLSKEGFEKAISNRDSRVVACFGAGDIGELIKSYYEKRI